MLPTDLPSFLKRVGTDEQCRRYLFEARWPEGFRCAGCGHERAWAHKARLVDECAACGKQHSLLAGTVFEQTKTGLARWFLAIYLVTSSQGGISAMELKRQMGLPGLELAARDQKGGGRPAARAAGGARRGRGDLPRRRPAGDRRLVGPRRARGQGLRP